MPNFLRVEKNILTVVIEVNKEIAHRYYSKQTIQKFVDQLKSSGLTKKFICLNVSFTEGFDADILKWIRTSFSDLNHELAVDIELEGFWNYLVPVPRVSHCTYIVRGFSFLEKFFLWRLKNQAATFTILTYISAKDIDRAIEHYSKLHKQYPQFEIVLHPNPEEDFSSSTASDYEVLRMEGYFPPDKKFQSRRPEHMRIDYKYSDVDLSPREIKIKGLNNFFGFKCHAGIEHIVVDKRGRVWPSSCGALAKISDSLDGEYNWPQEGFNCPKEACLKSDDILISKEEV